MSSPDKSSSTRRLRALVTKEFHQLVRDNSSFLIGVFLPIVLILIIGYGLSLDVKNAPIAVVTEDSSPTVTDALSFMEGSAYFSPTYVKSMHEAQELMRQRKVDAILRIPPDFTSRLYDMDADVQLILYGVDSTSALLIQGYVGSGLMGWAARQAQKNPMLAGNGNVVAINRMWFNDANSSTWYFVPGLVVLIMTMVGVFMTAMVVAREWERGTLEALFVSPVRPVEILVAKVIPYFFVGMLGFIICLLLARFLYHVPLHGSLLVVLLVSVLYLIVSLGMGLVISSVSKSQFLASQIALLASFLPALMLSGFIFDLRSVPTFIRVVGSILPATYYMEMIKTLFLAGDNWLMIQKNSLVLLMYAALFLFLALRVTKKKVQ